MADGVLKKSAFTSGGQRKYPKLSSNQTFFLDCNFPHTSGWGTDELHMKRRRSRAARAAAAVSTSAKVPAGLHRPLRGVCGVCGLDRSWRVNLLRPRSRHL